MRFRRRFQVIIGVAVLMALLFSGISFLLGPTTPTAYSLVDQTTLSVLRGKVEYMQAGESVWHAARGGEVLKVGDRVRTGGDSHALITFFEGTTTELEPESEAEITRLDKPEVAGEVGIGLKQTTGATWTRVAKMADVQSQMEVETPSAVATVRGTEFEVTVTPDKKTEVITSLGQVDLSSQGQRVPVEAGFLSVVELGKPPAPPVPAPPPKRALTIALHKSGRLFVTDSKGRSLGFFPETGSYINQIPGAWYSGSRSEPQVIALPDPRERYRIVISPGTKQPATASGRALVAGWYSQMEAASKSSWVSALPASANGESYTGQFQIELGMFLAEQMVSRKSAEGSLGADESISFEANVEEDELKGDIVLAHAALKQLGGILAPQVIAKSETQAPDPLALARDPQELIQNVARAVVAAPPKHYQAVVGQTVKADREPQKIRLEKVLREAVAEAVRYTEEKKSEELKTNPGLQAIATMASILAPSPTTAQIPAASTTPAAASMGTPGLPSGPAPPAAGTPTLDPIGAVMTAAALVAGTATPAASPASPPTATSAPTAAVASTATPVPPTATAVRAIPTAVPPTQTPVAPAATLEPATAEPTLVIATAPPAPSVPPGPGEGGTVPLVR